MISDFTTVAQVQDIPPGTGRTVEIKGVWIAVFNIEGTFYAIDNTCPHAGGVVEALRACLDRSLVFVDTPAGSGTGVMLDTGEIVTNAHVIDPFDRADIVLVGGERFDDFDDDAGSRAGRKREPRGRRQIPAL